MSRLLKGTLASNNIMCQGWRNGSVGEYLLFFQSIQGWRKAQWVSTCCSYTVFKLHFPASRSGSTHPLLTPALEPSLCDMYQIAKLALWQRTTLNSSWPSTLHFPNAGVTGKCCPDLALRLFFSGGGETGALFVALADLNSLCGISLSWIHESRPLLPPKCWDPKHASQLLKCCCV